MLLCYCVIVYFSGNLVADIMADSTGADIALLNSGTLRSNLIHPSGPFTNKDLLRILPLFDQLCVLTVTGRYNMRIAKITENIWVWLTVYINSGVIGFRIV